MVVFVFSKVISNSYQPTGYTPTSKNAFAESLQSDEVEGTVIALVKDKPGFQQFEMQYALEVKEGNKYIIYKIKDNTQATNFVGGTKLKVKKKDLESVALAGSDGICISCGGGSSEGVRKTGSFSTLVIMGNYKDSILPGQGNPLDPFSVDGLWATPEQLFEPLFSKTWQHNPEQVGGFIESTAKGYDRYTNGQVDFYNGVVIGTATLKSYSKEGTNCDIYGYATALNEYARSRGYEPNNYDKVTYVLPDSPVCSPRAGMAEMPGRLSWMWLWASTWDGAMFIATHEWGHNFGMGHAAAGPPLEEHYDPSDAMCCGGGRHVRFNSPHMWQMRWSDHKTQEVTNDGTYQIGALDYQDEHSKPSVLKADCSYFISYRHERNPKRDLNYGSKYQYTERVNIHTYAGWSSYACTDTLIRGKLAVGQTYVAPDCDLSVTFVSEDMLGTNIKGATVSINQAGGSPPTTDCIHATPLLDAKPESTFAKPGVPVEYLVTLTNKDSSTCSPTTFLLSAMLPTGFTGQFSSNSITLSSGQSGEVVLVVTSLLNQPNGNYQVKVQSSSNVDPIHSTSDISSLIIDGTPPSAVVLSASSTNRYIDLTWTDTKDDLSGKDKYKIYRDNALLVETVSTIYRDRAVSKGITYNYYIIAVDKAGNESPPSNTVQISLASKGGRK